MVCVQKPRSSPSFKLNMTWLKSSNGGFQAANIFRGIYWLRFVISVETNHIAASLLQPQKRSFTSKCCLRRALSVNGNSMILFLFNLLIHLIMRTTVGGSQELDHWLVAWFLLSVLGRRFCCIYSVVTEMSHSYRCMRVKSLALGHYSSFMNVGGFDFICSPNNPAGL